MALNTRGSVDPRWLTHNRGVLRALQLATVEIYSNISSSQIYNAETNTWSGDINPLYFGKARVQPVNAVNEIADNYNPTFIKTVRVQIEAWQEGMSDIRPNDRMRVTSCDPNKSLENFIYIVTDVMNSSNPWERTLLCKVDTELDPRAV